MSKRTIEKTNRRHEIFAREYVIDLNGRRAATAAGYSGAGVDVTAARLLKKPSVVSRVNDLLAKRASKLEIKSERILERFEAMASANMGDFLKVDDEGTISVDLRGKSRDELFGIQELSTETYLKGVGANRQPVQIVRIKLSDRQKANDSLARYRRLYADQPPVQLNVNFAGLSDAELDRRIKELSRASGEVIDSPAEPHGLLTAGEE